MMCDVTTTFQSQRNCKADAAVFLFRSNREMALSLVAKSVDSSHTLVSLPQPDITVNVGWI